MKPQDIFEAIRSKRGYILAIIAVIVLVAFSGPLVLDADEADLRYDRKSIRANRVNLPQPGDAYVYDVSIQDFKPTKVCSLHLGGAGRQLSPVSFQGYNEWGLGLNTAISNVGQFVGETILAGVQVNNPHKVWSFDKQYRADLANVEFDHRCLDAVVREMQVPHQFVMIVDTVYYEPEATEDPKMVQMSFSSIIPEGCGEACAQKLPLDNVLDVGWVTRKKSQWELVRFE